MNQRLIVILSVVTILCAAGCSRDSDSRLVPVTGRVTVQGKPAGGAHLFLYPADGKSNPSEARSDADGNFAVETSGKPGVAPGEYKVTISYLMNRDKTVYTPKPEDMDLEQLRMQGKVVESLPAKYTDLQMTELKIVVTDQGNSEVKFDL
ncbi:carboxypeptidase-like regulatory domain-containing protein [Planctomicrobium sp. SH527]|uniref:carboxypeptidase-like regulatory domain-containing protein n=1 Tax=Planctomicrobium sp. SH527 TaxID=3448123 RepID=UPI003F5C83B5